MKLHKPSSLRSVGAALASVFGLFVITGMVILSPVRAAASAMADAASSLNVLSAEDAQRYTRAFSAMHRGDFTAGENAVRGVADATLVGRLEAARLLHGAYHASYGELKLWLNTHGDLPEADRVYDLAMRRKPAGVSAPRAPSSAAQSSAVQSSAAPSNAAPSNAAQSGEAGGENALRADNGRGQAARNAFYKGEVEQAYVLASRSGERWIAGLSALRLKRYPEALGSLGGLAGDPRQNPWVRSAAAYWASRAATALNDPRRAHDLLRLASRSPDTFYGLIAVRELDQQAARAAPDGAADVDLIGDVLAAAAVDPESIAEFARSEPRAHRAAALIQVGLPMEASEDLRIGLSSGAAASRTSFTSLALELNAPFTAQADVARSGWARFDAGHFPTPQLHPQGGFTIDKALVYALVRQESRFDPDIISVSGAYGLMQLTADTAARVAGDDGLRRHPAALRDPALNLRLGQAYVTKLLAQVKGDVVRAVAAYNCGPGAMQRLTAKLGQDIDSLMLIESLPSGQTRDYVQRVMAGYWIYRQIFGQDSRSLNAAAAGTKVIASADL